MPVVIDEVTAEIEPPPAPEREAAAQPGGPSPELDPRRLREELRRLEARAARVRAD